MSFLPFPKYVFSNTFIYVYLRSLKNRKPEDPLLSTFLVFASGNLNLPIPSRFLSVCCRKVRVGLSMSDILEKKYMFLQFWNSSFFLLMLRNNLIYIEFFVSVYHFKLLAIVWTLLTRLERKFLENRWDLFLTLEEFRICCFLNAKQFLVSLKCNIFLFFLPVVFVLLEFFAA